MPGCEVGLPSMGRGSGGRLTLAMRGLRTRKSWPLLAVIILILWIMAGRVRDDSPLSTPTESGDSGEVVDRTSMPRHRLSEADTPNLTRAVDRLRDDRALHDSPQDPADRSDLGQELGEGDCGVEHFTRILEVLATSEGQAMLREKTSPSVLLDGYAQGLRLS